MMNVKTTRKAVTPIMATIILITITVLAGGFASAYDMGLVRTDSMVQSVVIKSERLEVMTGTANTVWFVTFQNTGTVAVTSATATPIITRTTESAVLIYGIFITCHLPIWAWFSIQSPARYPLTYR